MVRFFEITNLNQIRQNVNTYVDNHSCDYSEWVKDSFVLKNGVVGALVGTRFVGGEHMYFLRCGENTYVQIRRVGVSEISYSEFCLRYPENFENKRTVNNVAPLYSTLARLPILFNE